MSRATIILTNEVTRAKAMEWIRRAPNMTRVEFKASKRTVPQNDRMWAMLTDLAQQLVWHGYKLSPDDWKLVMMDGLRREMRVVPNMDGNGLVNLGQSSSDLSVSEMTDLMELIAAFGAKHGVKFHDDEAAA